MNRSGQQVLLLNASNMDAHPVYPYAFIQVPAVARQAGINVICKDFLGIPQARWEQSLQALIGEHNPAMVLITLRNVDSHTASDYEGDGAKAYFPIERTRELIAAVRAVSDLKIVLGGFAFSILPEEIMEDLRPDLGVFGGSDAFFAHFQDIQAGHLDQVVNLLYFDRGRLISNPRVFHPPFATTEYTPPAIANMMAFYDSFPSPGFQGAPIEIMRGCCQSCIFCSEPHVEGKQVRYRDLSAIMGDIGILVDHGITRLYMISSELNPQGNEFTLQLADSIRSFNQRQTEDRKVTWYGANYLLNFSLEEFDRLDRSGFTGGWFDVTALDDENARAMRTPYRNATLLAHLKTYAQFQRARLDRIRASETLQSTGQSSEHDDQDRVIGWSLFLGNPATTSETIRNTLKIANQEGLAQLFNNCNLNVNIRVFDYEDPDEATLAVTYSVTADLERTAYQPLLPSFAYPPWLLQEFGSEKEIELMFDHIAATYLSTRYRKTRKWHKFLRQNTTAASITSWIEELSDIHGLRVPALLKPSSGGRPSVALQQLFSEKPQGEDGGPREDLAKQLVLSLLSACLEAFPDLFVSLGLPATMDSLVRTTPYELAVAVLGRWCTDRELAGGLSEQARPSLSGSMQDLAQFCVRAILYRSNVLVSPKYRGLFVPGPE